MELSWLNEAACRGKWEHFFAPSNERPEAKELRVAKAKAICAECPVQEPCLEASVTEPWGVWGGLEAVDRGWLQNSTGTAKRRRRRVRGIGRIDRIA